MYWSKYLFITIVEEGLISLGFTIAQLPAAIAPIKGPEGGTVIAIGQKRAEKGERKSSIFLVLRPDQNFLITGQKGTWYSPCIGYLLLVV